MDDGVELALRVSSGAMPREALELLSRLGHAGARRALGRLPLDLTQAAAASWPEEDPPASAEHWLPLATLARPLDRATAITVALAMTDALSPCFEVERREPASALMGLYTGPAGAVVLSAQVVAALFPLGATMRRLAGGVRAWLAAQGEAPVPVWPEVLRSRERAALCAELTGASWPAVWAHHWLLRCVTDPEPGLALACVAAYADDAREDREALLVAAREAAASALCSPS